MRGRRLLLASVVAAAACTGAEPKGPEPTTSLADGVVLFEGAQLIVGDTTAPIELGVHRRRQQDQPCGPQR